MATKEALVIILDVGPGMCQGPDGEPTFFQQSLTAIDMILQRKMFSESKDEVSIVLFGTPETENELSKGGTNTYANIRMAKELGPVSWDLLKFVEQEIKPGNMSADFLDAIVVAMDHLHKYLQGKKGFTSRRILLLSNVSHEFTDDHLTDIIGSFKEQEIEFDIIGPNLDSDDDDSHGKASSASSGSQANGRGGEKPKSAQQKRGEAVLKRILDCDFIEGSSYSFREALHALSHFQSRQVRSTAWKCLLEIGTGLKLPICLYTRIKEVKAKSFKNVYAKDSDAEIERLRTSHLNNDEETEVDKMELVDGHRYGSTLVPFSAEDKDAMKFKTEKCFKVLGFTKADNVKRQQTMGDSTWVCVADKDDAAAVVALSALINALYETNMVIIVRRVYAANGAVRLGCLAPNIKKNYECLFYTELPFSEDLRQFTFGSLPVEEDDATSQAPNRKFTPSDEQLSAIDELIDSMDLASADRDVDNEPTEAVKPKLTFNPYLQRLYQCLQHRALNPDQPLPELSPIIANGLKVPESVATKSQSAVKKLKQTFKLEPVAKKETATGETVFKDNDDDVTMPAAKKLKLSDDSNLDGGLPGLLKTKITEVGSTTPVEDFRALITQENQFSFAEVHEMMQKRLRDLILESFGTQSYSKATDCLVALRQESLKNAAGAKLFNDFLTQLKATLFSKGRTNFWQEIVDAKLSLITKSECTTVDQQDAATQDAADKFLETSVAMDDKKPEHKEEEEADDLLDELQ